MTVLEQRLMESATKYFTTQNNKHIDWEQRRYEIAKDIYVSMVSDGSWNYEYPKEAIECADALIAELQKK